MPIEATAKDEDEINDDRLMTAFWSLLGGVAWTLVTRADVAVHIGHLQRRASHPTWKNARELNTVV
eukprot:7328611-Prorocentrum_lima.AAC.1